MSELLENARVGEIVASDFRAAPVFQRFGIDSCCGGRQSTADACRGAGAGQGAILSVLETLRPEDASADDVGSWPIGRLVAQIPDSARPASPSRTAATKEKGDLHGSDGQKRIPAAERRCQSSLEGDCGAEAYHVRLHLTKTDTGDTMDTIHSIAKIQSLILITAFSALLSGAATPADAAPQKVFKAGDKVMASPTSMVDEKYWRPCVITNVRDFGTFRGYDLECEPETRGGLPSSFFVTDQWVKTAPSRKVAVDNEPGNGGGKADPPGERPPTVVDRQGNFKAGDRVEVDVPMMADPGKSVYSRATIDEIDLPNRSYLVTVDPLPGKLPQQFRILIRDYGKHWIRPIRGADNPPQVLTEKLRTGDRGTVLADRALIDCEHLPHGGKNGSPPPTELLKKLIRCLSEQPSQPGMDGATTMDITAFNVGAARRWQIYRDMGQGSADTIVYPIQVAWNQKAFYRTRNEQRTGAEGTFTCFVDNFNLWQCGHADGPRKDGKVQQIGVKP